MKGTYVLLIRLIEDKEITIGKLGKIEFKAGNYLYVGSALNSLEGRIKRHLRIDKKIFWHIDYLLERAEIEDVFYKKSEKKEECVVAKKIAGKFKSIKGFGSSDCCCVGHLFYTKEKNGSITLIEDSGLKKCIKG